MAGSPALGVLLLFKLCFLFARPTFSSFLPFFTVAMFLYVCVICICLSFWYPNIVLQNVLEDNNDLNVYWGFSKGWTGQDICVAGDSAGGNLVLALSLKTIELGIRRPTAVFAAYTPVMLSMVPSPSRVLCAVDPLLPLGFMLTCLHGRHVEDMALALRHSLLCY